MKILFCGDVVGRSGRDVLLKHLRDIRRNLELDFVIVNGENSAGGFGITQAICRDMYEIGVDVITTGNHVWAQKEIISYIDQDFQLLRPLNYPRGAPGRGVIEVKLTDGRRVVVINLMGRLFMPDTLNDPFAAVEEELAKYGLGEGRASAIVIDFHAEATSEKMALAQMIDGRVSLVVGTHTHIPTADAQVLPGGTAYQTDAGMCGDYHSVIGMKPDIPIARFTRKLPTKRMEPAKGDGTLCAVLVETNDKTGLAKSVYPIRVGGVLSPEWPG
jgi:metallophosphoesterase (TIGR00282 family)